SIPRGLSDVVKGIFSLNDFFSKPVTNRIHAVNQTASLPAYVSGSGATYMSPRDFATIYNLTPLYNAGIDGSGQSIAIVGRTNRLGASADWANFRTKMGLPHNPPKIIITGAGDPGLGDGTTYMEADLDVEWAGAVAKNATIYFVTSMSTAFTDGAYYSSQYIVEENLWPVMSTSFESCEGQMTAYTLNGWKDLWQQAAAEGITVFAVSGDSGAVGCSTYDPAKKTVYYWRGVNGIASTPYNVAVGGTQFNEGNNSGYWGPDGFALSYIQEAAWNVVGAASGGGPSAIYDKPSWQVAPGVPADGKRDIPDVSLAASGSHDNYLVETMDPGSGLSILINQGGTSASTPSFAGIMALVVQKTNQRQGNANEVFYRLGNSQYTYGGTTVFHNITSGNNIFTPAKSTDNYYFYYCPAGYVDDSCSSDWTGEPGYYSHRGYNLPTGLGSVDAAELVNNFSQVPITYSATPSAVADGVSVGAHLR